jgi:excisionase family DNA binding protein
MHQPAKQLLTIQEAAALVGCSTKTLYRLMKDGLPYQRGEDGRRYMAQEHIQHLLSSATPVRKQEVSVPSALQAQINHLQTLVEHQTALLESMIAFINPKHSRR